MIENGKTKKRESGKNLAVWFALAIVFVAGASCWALGHHVVRTDRGILVLSKRFLTVRDSVVDVRSWHRLLGKGKPAGKVAVGILREGKALTLEATLRDERDL